MIVVDASALVDALVGPTPATAARLSREPLLHAPHLLPLEVASALRRLVAERRLSERGAGQALEKLEALPLRLHPHLPLLSRIWELRGNLTVYDAVYVALAEVLRLPLVTADARLAGAPSMRCAVEVVYRAPARAARAWHHGRAMSSGPSGTGPGPITPDGCAVDLYLLLRPRGEAELIHGAVPEGAGILELGCGTGRITRGLLELGHPVTGVDFSADMLEHMPEGARTVLHDIETLRLPERFEVVTLTSNMVSSGDEQALAFLRTARAHLDAGGLLVVERFHPRWADRDAMLSIAAPRTRDHITGSLHHIAVDGDVVSMTIRYEHDDGRVWTQRAENMHARSDAALDALLRQSGFRPLRFLDEDEDWILARAV